MDNTFGEKLKAIRQLRDKTQEDLAELLGTSKQVISRYENNQRTPKITTAQEYAAKLRVPLSYLIDNEIKVNSLFEDYIIPQNDDDNNEQRQWMKYRSLSKDAKEVVDLIIDREYERNKPYKNNQTAKGKSARQNMQAKESDNTLNLMSQLINIIIDMSEDDQRGYVEHLLNKYADKIPADKADCMRAHLLSLESKD